MVNIEYEKFNNIEELEFKIFKELNISLKEPIDISLRDKFNELFSKYCNIGTFLIVCETTNKQVICGDEYYYYLLDNILNLNIGETFLLKNDEIFRVETSILNESFLDECLKKLENSRKLNIDDLAIKGDLLKKEDIEKGVEETINETEKDRLDKLQEKKEEKEKEKGIYEERKKYEEESIFESKGENIRIDKDKITIWDGKLILTKNVNKILDYDFMCGYSVSFENIKEKLIEKEEGFIYYGNNKKIYELKFETNKKEEIIKSLEEKDYYSKVKLNGVRVRRNKILSILGRINENTTKEEIKLWSKFTQMQLDLLDTETIHIERIPISINFSYGSKNKFIVELLGKKEEIHWDILNRIFFLHGGSRSMGRSPSISKFIELSQRLGLTKQEVYDKLKEASEKNEN